MASPSPATSCEAPSAKHKVDKGEAASGEGAPEEYVRAHDTPPFSSTRTAEGALPISEFRERSDRPRPRGQGARPGERTGEAKKRRRPNKHGASALTIERIFFGRYGLGWFISWFNLINVLQGTSTSFKVPAHARELAK